MHEVRRQALGEQAPLVQRFADQAEVEALQIAQAAVDELAGPAGRAGGEVALLDQRDREAAAGGVERDTAAGDASADDQHVEELGAEPLELATAGVPRRSAAEAAHLSPGHQSLLASSLVHTSRLVCTMTAVPYSVKTDGTTAPRAMGELDEPHR